MEERRVILVGKTGNGKSSTGNTLLGYPGFANGQNSTECCDYRTSIERELRPLYKVCDTPGLMDADSNLVDRVMEIQRAVEICREPHAFLLVLDASSAISADEQCTIDFLRVMFGEKVFEHCIVVFTHGDKFQSNAAFTRFWQESELLVAMMQVCGNRVVRIDNTSAAKRTASTGIHNLLGMIEEVSNRGQLTYSYSWLSSHTDVLKQHRLNYRGEMDIPSQLAAISESLGERLTNDKWTTGLFLGGFGVFGVATLGGIGAMSLVAFKAIPAVGAAVGILAGKAMGGTAGGRAALDKAGNYISSLKFW